MMYRNTDNTDNTDNAYGNGITFVTGNKKKLDEAKAILGRFEISNTELEIDEIQGSAEKVAKDKVRKAYSILKRPCFVDDTSFECSALGGLPGIYIRYFLDEIKPEGIYRMIDNFEDKTAEAVCMIAYMDESLDEPVAFRGSVHGRIVPPRKDNGFGFDLIFIPDGHDKTFSEMDNSEKNLISHRKRALELLKSFLEKRNRNDEHEIKTGKQ